MANYTCEKCKKVFPSVSELNKHLLEHLEGLEQERDALREQEKKQEIKEAVPAVSGLDKIKAELMKTLEVVSLTTAIKNMAASPDTLKQFLDFQKVNADMQEQIIASLPEEPATSGVDLQALISLFTNKQNGNENDNSSKKSSKVSKEKKL